MDAIFFVVMVTLQIIASITGLTYNEINIIVYYMMVPLVFAVLIDRLYGCYLKLLVVGFWSLAILVIPNFKVFCDRLFDVSVKFLNLFSYIGVDYIAASVVVCVLLPIAGFMAIFWCGRRIRAEQLACKTTSFVPDCKADASNDA